MTDMYHNILYVKLLVVYLHLQCHWHPKWHMAVKILGRFFTK